MRQSYKENVITISVQDDNESEVAIQSPRSPIANEDLKKEEHQIRIEISKTGVIESMRKEHEKDLSLLYYDFNNSKARLMSKMRKMSDFMIQEEAGEAEAD